jgi:hypothetical protein
LITDGSNPINLFQTANGLIGAMQGGNTIGPTTGRKRTSEKAAAKARDFDEDDTE